MYQSGYNKGTKCLKCMTSQVYFREDVWQFRCKKCGNEWTPVPLGNPDVRAKWDNVRALRSTALELETKAKDAWAAYKAAWQEALDSVKQMDIEIAAELKEWDKRLDTIRHPNKATPVPVDF